MTLAPDMLTRQKAGLPRGWFPDVSPVLDALLTGATSVFQSSYDLLLYVGQQSRLSTASDGWLDLAAYDFLGLRFRRHSGQTDDSFRAALLAEIFRERVTRRGIEQAVEDLTGIEVRTFEPWNPTDCGGFDTGYLGWDMLGRWGAVDLPRQIFIALTQPLGAGIPNVGAFDGTGIGGFDTGAEEYGDLSQVVGPVTDQNIYDTINATRAAGITAWVAIGYQPEGHLDLDFLTDISEAIGPAR